MTGNTINYLAEGTILENRYRVDSVLAHGGMGAVYKAFDLNLEIAVALKENLLRTPQSIKQFKKEALILARLRHSGLPRVTAHFSSGDQQYLVMDFIEGQNLWELVHKGESPLDEKQALRYIIQVCQAVSYLHNHNPKIIHRDIKPQNIKVTPDGRAVLVDFGIAKIAEGDNPTETGARGVTHGFSAPEMYGDETRTTPASDIYSLGATLYAALTGQKPPDSVSLLTKQVKFKSPHKLNPYLSQQITPAIVEAMQMEPDKRPKSVAAWQQRLEEIYHSLPPGQGVETVAEFDRPVVRRRAGSSYWYGVVIVVAATLLLCAFAFFFVFIKVRLSTDNDTPTAIATAAAVMVLTPADTPTLVGEDTPTEATSITETPTDTLSPAEKETPTEAVTSTTTPLVPTVSLARSTATDAPTLRPTSTATASPSPIPPTKTPTPTPTMLASAPPPPRKPAQVIFVQSVGAGHFLGMVSSTGELLNYSVHEYAASPAWSPTGTQIAFFGEPAINLLGGSYSAGGGLWLLDALDPARNPTRQLKAEDYIKSIAWAPDGAKIAYETAPPGSVPTIVVVDPLSGREISRFPGGQPAWSPDGQQMAIKACAPGCGIWQVNFEGYDGQQITFEASDSYPSWSRNNVLAFCTQRDGNWEIYTLNLNTGSMERVTEREGTDVTPVFSPDGREIYLRTDTYGGWRVTALELGRGDERTIKEGVGDSADWGLARPAVN
jgi:serine/threonine-protein kinase